MKAFQRKQESAGSVVSGEQAVGATADGTAIDGVAVGDDMPFTDFAKEAVDKALESMGAIFHSRPSAAGTSAKAARPEVLHFKLGSMAAHSDKPVSR